MAEDEEPETSPDAGPPATGERSDHRTTAPGVEMPHAPERREAPDEAEEQGAQPAGDAPDEGAAREREDDRS
ncbi:MAG: hypothetical protein M3331_02575 [Actinomycetota bacterium]|nr:hypothetical protein [Actinomycetota bacterium]